MEHYWKAKKEANLYSILYNAEEDGVFIRQS